MRRNDWQVNRLATNMQGRKVSPLIEQYLPLVEHNLHSINSFGLCRLWLYRQLLPQIEHNLPLPTYRHIIRINNLPTESGLAIIMHIELRRDLPQAKLE